MTKYCAIKYFEQLNFQLFYNFSRGIITVKNITQLYGLIQ